jgi:hypothetical protein
VRATCPAHHSLLDLTMLMILVKSTNYEAPPYVIFSILLLQKPQQLKVVALVVVVVVVVVVVSAENVRPYVTKNKHGKSPSLPPPLPDWSRSSRCMRAAEFVLFCWDVFRESESGFQVLWLAELKSSYVCLTQV